MTGPRRGLFSLVLLGAFAGCDSYERTNPLDPGSGLQVSLAGPDSVFSLNDTIRFSVVTIPEAPGLPFAWATSDSLRLAPVEGRPGSFTTLANGVAFVYAENGPYRLERSVVIQQRAVRLRIAPPSVTDLESLGEVVNLSASIVDGRNTPVQGAATDLRWSSTETQVADVVDGRVTARGNGDVWIRATSLGQRDSVPLRVRQRPTSIQFGSATYTIALPGGAVQTVITVRDARGNPVAAPQGLAVSSSRPAFLVDNGGRVRSTGFGSTEITARIGELEARTLVRVAGGTPPIIERVLAGLTRFEGEPRAEFLLVEIEARDAELDLDEGTVEVYSTADTWITTRVVGLEQGQAVHTAAMAVRAPAAGSARVRLRDAALNNSLLQTVSTQLFPQAGSPSGSVRDVVRLSADSIEVGILAVDAEADLRRVYLFGFASDGETVFSRSVAVPRDGNSARELRLGARTGEMGRVTRVGVVLSDAGGRLSTVYGAALGGFSATLPSAALTGWGRNAPSLTPSTTSPRGDSPYEPGLAR